MPARSRSRDGGRDDQRAYEDRRSDDRRYADRRDSDRRYDDRHRDERRYGDRQDHDRRHRGANDDFDRRDDSRSMADPREDDRRYDERRGAGEHCRDGSPEERRDDRRNDHHRDIDERERDVASRSQPGCNGRTHAGDSANEEEAYGEAAVSDGIPKRDGTKTWRAEIHVPRPGPAFGNRERGMVCVRGPNRFNEQHAHDDLDMLKKKAVEVGPAKASKDVRALATKLQQDFDKEKHVASGHGAR